MCDLDDLCELTLCTAIVNDPLMVERIVGDRGRATQVRGEMGEVHRKRLVHWQDEYWSCSHI